MQITSLKITVSLSLFLLINRHNGNLFLSVRITNFQFGTIYPHDRFSIPELFTVEYVGVAMHTHSTIREQLTST